METTRSLVERCFFAVSYSLYEICAKCADLYSAAVYIVSFLFLEKNFIELLPPSGGKEHKRLEIYLMDNVFTVKIFWVN